MSFFVVSREAANNDRPVVTTEDASFKTQYYEPNPKSGVGPPPPPPHTHTHPNSPRNLFLKRLV